MRFLFICFFLFFHIISNAQNERKERINEMIRRAANPFAPIVQELKEPVELKEQIESFITFLKNENYYSKRSLYIIKMYEYDYNTISHDYCFSVSYIANSQEFYPGLFTHYFIIGDDAVVLNAYNPYIESVFSTCGIIAIGKENVNILISRLAPSYNGMITVRYDPQGMEYCKKGENIKKTFYRR